MTTSEIFGLSFAFIVVVIVLLNMYYFYKPIKCSCGNKCLTIRYSNTKYAKYYCDKCKRWFWN